MFDYFIDAIILKRSCPFLFWNGTESLLKETLNPTRARLWYSRVQSDVEFKEWSTKFLGTSITKMVPTLRAESPLLKPDPLTTHKFPLNNPFEVYVGQLTRSKTINDESYQLLIHFSRSFHLFAFSQSATELIPLEGKPLSVYILPKNEEELASSKFSFSFKDTQTQTEITGSLKDYLSLTEEDRKYQNCLLTIKEVMDDYVDLRWHSVVIPDENGQSKAHTYKMSEDVRIILDTADQKVILIEQERCQYDSIRTQFAWNIVNEVTKEQIDYRNFESYTINTLVEGSLYQLSDGSTIQVPPHHKYTEYILRGAYTHILRKILNFNPQQWQLQYLLGEKRENYLAGCRRMGKTALAAYLVPRELFCMPNKKMFRNRPRKALFIAPTKDKNKEVLDYFMEYTNKIRELRNIVYNTKLDRITFEDQVIGVGKSRVATPLSICDFGTSRGFEAGRGKAADWIGVEEAGYVSEQVFDNIMPIVEGEGAKFFCISTINADDTAQWFLRELTKAEEKMRDPDSTIAEHIFALRVTIDEIDERVMTKAQKESTKERALLRGYSYYYAELFATVPSKNSVFDTNGFFIQPLASKPASGTIIIAYDPAKRSDYGAVTISGAIDNRLILFETVRWQGLDYHEQRDKFKIILDRYRGATVYTVMDSTGVGEAVREIFRGLINYHVWYSTRKQPAKFDNYGTWNVGKRDLVEMCQALIESKQLAATADQEVLANEMVAFTEFKTRQGSYSYSAKVGHDDVVNAMLLTSFIYGKMLGHNREASDIFAPQSKRGYGYKPKPNMLKPNKSYGFK